MHGYLYCLHSNWWYFIFVEPGSSNDGFDHGIYCRYLYGDGNGCERLYGNCDAHIDSESIANAFYYGW